jgi:hypothetical protein
VCIKKTRQSIKTLEKEHDEALKRHRFDDHTTPEKLSNIVNLQIIKLTEGNNAIGMTTQLPSSFLKSSPCSSIL